MKILKILRSCIIIELIVLHNLPININLLIRVHLTDVSHRQILDLFGQIDLNLVYLLVDRVSLFGEELN